MRFTVTLSDKYASGKASQDNCEAYLSCCDSNDTLPRTSFTVRRRWPLRQPYFDTALDQLEYTDAAPSCSGSATQALSIYLSASHSLSSLSMVCEWCVQGSQFSGGFFIRISC
jgi:hypothetical protein